MNNLSSTSIETAIDVFMNHHGAYFGELESLQVAEALRELLALREAQREPVAWQWHNTLRCHVTNDEERARNLAWDGVKVIPLYAAPQPLFGLQPAPALESTDKTGEPPASIAEVWVMVPVEPTENMIQEGRVCGSAFIYRRMIAAAPKPE